MNSWKEFEVFCDMPFPGRNSPADIVLETAPLISLDGEEDYPLSDSSFLATNYGKESDSTVTVRTSKSSNYGSLSPPLRQKGKVPGRTITKDGDCAFISENIGNQNWKFIEDGFTSVLEVRWRWALLLFLLLYFSSWAFFALLWYAICYFHNDLINVDNPFWKPCVSNIDGFVTAFLFSVETQQTIGFGSYHITEDCIHAVILVCLQSIVGVILQGTMVGMLFVKMSRAKKRSATLMFSKTATISMRDGCLYLMVRVGDMRTRSHLLEAHVRAQFIGKRTTREGEVIKYHQTELEIGGDGEKNGRILLFWPTVLLHKIDESSPLYEIAPAELTQENVSFEIVVILEGINEATGLSAQARTSYLPSEIIWGHRFKDLHHSKNEDGSRRIDYALFHHTYPVQIPRTSAFDLHKLPGDKLGES